MRRIIKIKLKVQKKLPAEVFKKERVIGMVDPEHPSIGFLPHINGFPTTLHISTTQK